MSDEATPEMTPEQMAERLAFLESENVRLESELKETKQERANARREVTNTKKELTDAQATLGKAQGALLEVQGLLDDARGQIKSQGQIIEGLRADVDRMDAAARDAQATIDSANAARDEALRDAHAAGKAADVARARADRANQNSLAVRHAAEIHDTSRPIGHTGRPIGFVVESTLPDHPDYKGWLPGHWYGPTHWTDRMIRDAKRAGVKLAAVYDPAHAEMASNGQGAAVLRLLREARDQADQKAREREVERARQIESKARATVEARDQ